MPEEKIRENRLRRMAARQGLVLKKSARRDHLALDYGMYALVPVEHNLLGRGAVSGRFDMTIDQVEERLTQPVPPMLGHGARPTRDEPDNRGVVQHAAVKRRTSRRGGKQGHA
jgi:hypothetical protein